METQRQEEPTIEEMYSKLKNATTEGADPLEKPTHWMK